LSKKAGFKISQAYTGAVTLIQSFGSALNLNLHFLFWFNKFRPAYSRRLKRRHQGFDDTFYIDEVFVKIRGKLHYLWRAVDQDGEIVDVFLQTRRNGAAAKRFLNDY